MLADELRLWRDLMWAQLYYIKENYENADVIFNNGNFGFMRALAILREREPRHSNDVRTH